MIVGNMLNLGGGSVSLGTKSIVSNGVYSASADNLDGYSEITVSLPEYSGPYQIAPSTVTQAFPTAGLVMTDDVTLGAYSVPEAFPGSYTIIPSTVSKTISTSGCVMEDNLRIEAFSAASLISTKVIIDNGTYTASEEGADGYANVRVAVSRFCPLNAEYSGPYTVSPSTTPFSVLTGGMYMREDFIVEAFPTTATLGTLTASANGVYSASADNLDGYSTVTVGLPMYSGSYEIPPTFSSQTFPTAGLLMSRNITVGSASGSYASAYMSGNTLVLPTASVSGNTLIL